MPTSRATMLPLRRASSYLRCHRVADRAHWMSTDATHSKDHFKILVLGGGSGGLSVAQQLYNRFDTAGKPLKAGDIAIVDAAEHHNYQQKSALRRPLAGLIPPHITHIPENVASFDPAHNAVRTDAGRSLAYDALVVATGLQVNFGAIEGLSKALADPSSGVSSIYSYQTCDKAWEDIDALRAGRAIFTQPKASSTPQKIMWMAWDRYRKTGRRDQIKIDFFTGTPTMFSPTRRRGVGGYFGRNLVSIDAANRKAVEIKEDYTLLHVTPPMGPLDVLKGSPIADAAGWVEVDKGTLQHAKPEYSNTAAAITSQAPVLTENLFHLLDSGKIGSAVYDGYTSCPLLTSYGGLMLAEFKYGLVPAETFSRSVGDQGIPRRVFYHLKKDLFPWVYFRYHVKGRWFGPAGLSRPKFV
ncbi:FAD/NAD-P-binding domain-containing protein [Russula brevipes]|nr:FAD/NAD-P-binding domain-containing protein [Russula brevipes]